MTESSTVSSPHHSTGGQRRQLSPSLFIVVLNWNLPQDTVSCVRSLFAAGASHGQVIVLDNGSADDSVERLQAEFGDSITLIESQTNMGFAGGNNVAIAFALGQGAEWVFLINNDTVVAPTMLAEMSAAIEQHPAHRLLSPLIFYHDEPDRIWSLGDRRLFGTLVTKGIHRNRIKPKMLPPFVGTDFLNACALLVHRSVFQKIGGFDTRFFMYAEDVDFCWRARSAGFRLGCATGAHMWHKVSRSTGIHHPQSRYWRVTNQIRFYRRYAHGVQWILLFLFTATRVLRMGLGDLLHRRPALAYTTVCAWKEGWFNPDFAPAYGTAHGDGALAVDLEPSQHPARGITWKP